MGQLLWVGSYAVVALSVSRSLWVSRCGSITVSSSLWVCRCISWSVAVDRSLWVGELLAVGLLFWVSCCGSVAVGCSLGVGCCMFIVISEHMT